MNIVKNDEIHYCTHCGAANKKSAVDCSECDKKIHSKYRPFYDFLKKHTKDELTGTIADSVFSYVQNFLLSHVYGVLLSVSIVAAAASVAYGSTPYIHKTSEPKTSSVAVSSRDIPEEPQEPAEVSAELTEDDLYDFLHLAGSYDGFADELRPEDGRYWDGEMYYSNVSDMYAETNIPGFIYGGVHEMIANPISIGWDHPGLSDSSFSYQYMNRYTDESSAVTGQDCSTDLAKRLVAAGYRVAECDYIMLLGASEDENHDALSGPGDICRLKYRFVFVEYEGEWYIAEDRLTERYNV